MIWTEKDKQELVKRCKAGMSNKELAAMFNVPLAEIYSKRSALGITIDKCQAKPKPKPSQPKKAEPSANETLRNFSAKELVAELTRRRGVTLIEPKSANLLLIAANLLLIDDPPAPKK